MADASAGRPRSPGSRGAPVADEATVRLLLRAQAPALSALPLRRGPSGWDNDHWLLGDHLAVRIPRRELSAQLVVAEASWLPALAVRLPVAVPVPVVAGTPGRGWPWPWTVVPWLLGERLDGVGPAGPGVVDDLAAVLAALHAGEAPPEAPVNPYRGVPLAEREAGTRDRLAELRRWRDAGRLPDGVPAAAHDVLLAAFERGVAALVGTRRTWVHGDLHPGNVLVDGDQVVALVDWGDVCGGDPAADLAVRWWAVPVEHHERFVAALPAVDADTWSRAAGWAAVIAAYLLTQAPRAGDTALLGTAVATVDRLAVAPPV